MTSRQLYEGVLIEVQKENAQNLLLEDFNYFANRAIYQYTNKRYNIYDVNQQTTDDLRVLKANAILIPHRVDNYDSLSLVPDGMATYYVDLPSDYLHLLNCICIYNVKKTYKCYNAGDTWRAAATRLTADAYSQVLDNFWLKPTYKRPYYYIHNINTREDNPTNPYNDSTREGTDINGIKEKFDIDSDNFVYYLYENKEYYLKESQDGKYMRYDPTSQNISYFLPGQPNKKDFLSLDFSFVYDVLQHTSYYVISLPNDSGTIEKTQYDLLEEIQYRNIDGNGNPIATVEQGTPKTISIFGNDYSNVERSAGVRYGNASKVRMEIRYGTDNSVFTLDHSETGPLSRGGKIYIDYIKAPQHIRLTQEELDYTEDKSQMLEFPDYVCQEILNELVHIILEWMGDPKLQTHPVVSQSIANPAQAQAPEAAG